MTKRLFLLGECTEEELLNTFSILYVLITLISIPLHPISEDYFYLFIFLFLSTFSIISFFTIASLFPHQGQYKAATLLSGIVVLISLLASGVSKFIYTAFAYELFK